MVTETHKLFCQLNSENQGKAALIMAWAGLGESVGLGIVCDGVILKADRNLADLLGVAAEQLIGQNGYSYVHPDSLPAVIERQARDTEEPYRITMIRANGSNFEAEILPVVIFYLGRKCILQAVRRLECWPAARARGRAAGRRTARRV